MPTEQPLEKGLSLWLLAPGGRAPYSTPYCRPVEYFMGHQHGDIFMAIYLLRQRLATQEKPCGSPGSSTLCTVKLHLFPKMGEPERKGWTHAPA